MGTVTVAMRRAWESGDRRTHLVLEHLWLSMHHQGISKKPRQIKQMSTKLANLWLEVIVRRPFKASAIYR